MRCKCMILPWLHPRWELIAPLIVSVRFQLSASGFIDPVHTACADKLGDTMSDNSYAFVLDDGLNWRTSVPDDWNWEIVQLEGNEQLIGHYPIDGSVYKIFKTSTGKIVATIK